MGADAILAIAVQQLWSGLPTEFGFIEIDPFSLIQEFDSSFMHIAHLITHFRVPKWI